MDIYGVGKLIEVSSLSKDNPEIKKWIRYANRPFKIGYDSYSIMLEENNGEWYFLHSTPVSYGGACLEKPEHIEKIGFTVVKSLLRYELNRYKTLLEKALNEKSLNYVTFYQTKIQKIEKFMNSPPCN